MGVVVMSNSKHKSWCFILNGFVFDRFCGQVLRLSDNATTLLRQYLIARGYL